MAKQTINQGTAPTGAGGDTFRSGSAKLQANDDELYNALGANASGVLPAALPLTKGGTGATTAAAARSNLGLGTAATMDVTASIADYGSGKVMTVGAFGWGQDNRPVSGNIGLTKNAFDIQSTVDELARAQVVSSNNDGTGGYPNGVYFPAGSTRGHAIMGASINNNLYHYCITGIRLETGRVTTKSLIRTAANTTVDSNGFLKNASPIVELYADKIELNDEAKLQNITFEKLGVGDYLIKGSTGFAQEGWYIETPKDANGNLLVAVVYEQLENGDISVKTYDYMLNNKGRIVADTETPLDIPETRWIDLRLQELPQPEIEVTDGPEQ